MEVKSFIEIQEDFFARVQEAVYCSMATVDRKSRPRSRIMHPVWDGSIGWVISWPGSHKAKHLENHPYVSLAYIQNAKKPVYVDAIAHWIDRVAEKQRIWKLYKETPPPLGYDPEPYYGSIYHQYFGLLQLTPWRIELGDLEGEPVIWRTS